MELTKEHINKLTELIKKNHRLNMGTKTEPRWVGQTNFIGSVKNNLQSILPELNEILKGLT